MFFLRDYALPVTLTFDVRMNNALRAAMITWFQQPPAIVITLLPRDPLSRFYMYLWSHHLGAALLQSEDDALTAIIVLIDLVNSDLTKALQYYTPLYER